MTSGERVYLAVSGGVPDRVPFVPKIWIDLAARILGEDLLETAGDPEKAFTSTARAALKLGLDGARLFHLPARRFRRAEDGQVIEIDERGNRIGKVDFEGGLATELDDAKRFDVRDPAWTAFAQFRASTEPFVKTAADVKALAVPDRRFWEACGAVERTERAIAEYDGKLALLGDLGSATLSYCASFRGVQRTLFDLLDEPDLVRALIQKGIETAVERAKFNIDAGIKILRLNDSTGTVSLISPEVWRDFVFPGFRDVAAAVKAYDPSARVYSHICGNILPVAQDLVEAGIDCLGPLDPLGGSTPGRLREIVGSKAALMGGINTLTFLNGTREEIVLEALDCLRAGGGYGGFVLGSGCMVPRGARIENLEAVQETILKYGGYENGKLTES